MNATEYIDTLARLHGRTDNDDVGPVCDGQEACQGVEAGVEREETPPRAALVDIRARVE